MSYLRTRNYVTLIFRGTNSRSMAHLGVIEIPNDERQHL